MVQSYTSTRIGVTSRINEALNLYRAHSRDVPGRVAKVLRQLRHAEEEFKRQSGRELQGLEVLEIGPGQMLKYLRYFALRNNATGIDLDVVSDSLSISALMRMWRINGATRTGKTIIRRMLRLDSRFHKEFCRQLGVAGLPGVQIFQMNAERMTFPDLSFDFVFSHSTFEHISDPGSAIDEVNRVLKLGGVAYIDINLYTSESGCHDPRISAGRRADLPFWSHLRPAHSEKVKSNAYLNKISLADWRKLCRSKIPTVSLSVVEDESPALRNELKSLRRAGELTGYTDEELLTSVLTAVWKRS